MDLCRRDFLRMSGRAGIFATTSMLFSHPASAAQLSQQLSISDYKALVVITLNGGNDGNNTVVPMDASQFAAYAKIRQNLALGRSTLLPLNHSTGAPAYGLHPSLHTVASLYNSGRALVAANIGPIVRPSTKQQVISNAQLFPGGSRAHDVALREWEQGQVAETGWGGRLADLMQSQSGSLPTILTTAQSWFTTGKTVQAVAVQAGAAYPALPPELTDAISNMARTEQTSPRPLVAATASLRSKAMGNQQLLNRAAAYDTLKTSFSSSAVSRNLKMVAQLIAGRSVTGASRQIFYLRQGDYDNHQNQASTQAESLADLDQGLSSFLAALDELGMRDQVLICTHSDFNRSLQPNTSNGTDHAWGNHHFIIGGGIMGGRIVGEMPDMELGGALDIDTIGCWIPTQSVTQMTAGMSSWFGLSRTQVDSVFPDLKNFPAGAISLAG